MTECVYGACRRVYDGDRNYAYVPFAVFKHKDDAIECCKNIHEDLYGQDDETNEVGFANGFIYDEDEDYESIVENNLEYYMCVIPYTVKDRSEENNDG